MKKAVAVVMILAMLCSVAFAMNESEMIEAYNNAAEFTGVPKITVSKIEGSFFFMETGIIVYFIKSKTSDDIDLVSCITFGQPYGEGFLLTVATILEMLSKTDSIMDFGRLMYFFIMAKKYGEANIRTSNNLLGRISYKPEQYQFYIELP